MTDLKVVSFDPKADLKADAVERARDLLAMAEAGELADFSYAATAIDGGLIVGFTGTDDAPRRLAAVSRLLYRLHRQMDVDSGTC